MAPLLTVVAVVVIASPFLVLALRTTRWDPFRTHPDAGPAVDGDADARRSAADLAAVSARFAQDVPPLPPTSRPRQARAAGRTVAAGNG